MKIIIDIKDKEIKRLQEAVGFPTDVENVDSDEVAWAIHTLIDACM